MAAALRQWAGSWRPMPPTRRTVPGHTAAPDFRGINRYLRADGEAHPFATILAESEQQGLGERKTLRLIDGRLQSSISGRTRPLNAVHPLNADKRGAGFRGKLDFLITASRVNPW